MKYHILPIDQFGHLLFRTQDLDPVYVMLTRAGLDFETKSRFCLAYWCLYDVGTAAYAAQLPLKQYPFLRGDDPNAQTEWFWMLLRRAAENLDHVQTPFGTRWPRGKERRHWRAENALNSYRDLRLKHKTAESFVTYVLEPEPLDAVLYKVMHHKGFGPWIAFKIADMLEQCFDAQLAFDESTVFMYQSPREAALRLWQFPAEYVPSSKVNEDECLRKVCGDLLHIFQGHLAPNGKRPCNLQEIETVLCKYKSHVNGHYPVGNDIQEIRHSLAPWVNICPLAERLLACVPSLV